MKIEIPDEICKEIGITEDNKDNLLIEVTVLANRTPTEVTGSDYPDGIVVCVKEETD